MNAELAWWGVGGLTGLVGLALLVPALFRDRARGRRRCPRCWYEFGGVPGLRCPECGATASSERWLGRTRRHWRCAAVGCVLLLGGVAGAAFPIVSGKGAL